MVRLAANHHRSTPTPRGENDVTRSGNVPPLLTAPAEPESSHTLCNDDGANDNPPKNEDEPVHSTIRKVGGSPRPDTEVQLSQVETPVLLRKSSPTAIAAQNGSATRVRLESNRITGHIG